MQRILLLQTGMLRMSRAVREMLAVLSGLMALLLTLCRLLAAPRGAGWLWLWKVLISALCWPLVFLMGGFWGFFSLSAWLLALLRLSASRHRNMQARVAHTHPQQPRALHTRLRHWAPARVEKKKKSWRDVVNRSDVRRWCWFQVEVSEVWTPAQDTLT